MQSCFLHLLEMLLALFYDDTSDLLLGTYYVQTFQWQDDQILVLLQLLT